MFSAPSAPFIRNVTVLSPNSVFLQWDPPTVFYRRVDKYVLKWWDTRGNDPDTMVSGTKTQVCAYVLSGPPKGVISDVNPLAGISGLSFDLLSSFSAWLFYPFCLVIFLLTVHSPDFFAESSNIFH